MKIHGNTRKTHRFLKGSDEKCADFFSRRLEHDSERDGGSAVVLKRQNFFLGGRELDLKEMAFFAGRARGRIVFFSSLGP